MLVKLDHFPKFRGEHKKCEQNHQVVSIMLPGYPESVEKTTIFFRWNKKSALHTQGLPNGSAKVTEKPNSYLHDSDGWLFLKHQKNSPRLEGVTNSPNFWKVAPEIEGDFEKVTPPYDFVPYFFNQNNNWKGLTHSMNLAKRPTNPSFFGGKVKAQHSWFTHPLDRSNGFVFAFDFFSGKRRGNPVSSKGTVSDDTGNYLHKSTFKTIHRQVSLKPEPLCYTSTTSNYLKPWEIDAEVVRSWVSFTPIYLYVQYISLLENGG